MVVYQEIKQGPCIEESPSLGGAKSKEALGAKLSVPKSAVQSIAIWFHCEPLRNYPNTQLLFHLQSIFLFLTDNEYKTVAPF